MSNNNIREAILELKKRKNAVILGHYYQRHEIQELSDYVGDSLALAQKAQEATADIIVFCGVHFMAETAKILNPSRKVLLPDMEASCSLAESCKASDFAAFKAQHPDHMVISYVNCSAEIKALSDLICTSGNAEKLVRALPDDQKIIFAPDKNLGGYINRVTGRNMLLWNGVCTVHDAMQAEAILQLKAANPDAPVIAHPECNAALLEVADFIGSTKAMLSFIKKSDSHRFIVATETGILFEMKRENPDKEFITLRDDKSCACDDCAYMKLNTLEKLYECLRDESPEIVMDEQLIEAAKRPIVRMLDMSKTLGIIK
ncbi:MAG: quinolinate synthase NadA [Bacteroidales bacterium]|nr:quinolinate synthase NadA [Bacteroidales bacterium]MBQ9639904.1 quinolinate synthase NadA [Bacteroidales bacterium]